MKYLCIVFIFLLSACQSEIDELVVQDDSTPYTLTMEEENMAISDYAFYQLRNNFASPTTDGEQEPFQLMYKELQKDEGLLKGISIQESVQQLVDANRLTEITADSLQDLLLTTYDRLAGTGNEGVDWVGTKVELETYVKDLQGTSERTVFLRNTAMALHGVVRFFEDAEASGSTFFDVSPLKCGVLDRLKCVFVGITQGVNYAVMQAQNSTSGSVTVVDQVAILGAVGVGAAAGAAVGTWIALNGDLCCGKQCNTALGVALEFSACSLTATVTAFGFGEQNNTGDFIWSVKNGTIVAAPGSTCSAKSPGFLTCNTPTVRITQTSPTVPVEITINAPCRYNTGNVINPVVKFTRNFKTELDRTSGAAIYGQTVFPVATGTTFTRTYRITNTNSITNYQFTNWYAGGGRVVSVSADGRAATVAWDERTPVDGGSVGVTVRNRCSGKTAGIGLTIPGSRFTGPGGTPGPL